MKEEAYLAALEFTKGAVDRGDVKRMKYWLGRTMDIHFENPEFPTTFRGMGLLSNEYREKIVKLLTESCRK